MIQISWMEREWEGAGNSSQLPEKVLYLNKDSCHPVVALPYCRKMAKIVQIYEDTAAGAVATQFIGPILGVYIRWDSCLIL